MKIILNREDIEEAIQAYIRDKFMSYGDDRQVNVTQGTKAMATVTLGEKSAQLPGLEDEDEHTFTAEELCVPTETPDTPEPEDDTEYDDELTKEFPAKEVPQDKTNPFNIKQ
ncbi:MAG: hypothetical protein KAH01_04145 [Caldisericia bacterium]|nr:hypothetical protein [Caldisericia bacterium]